jgi:hypothetical protein
MTLNSFLEKLKQTPQNITFTETIAVRENYTFLQQHLKMDCTMPENSVLVNCSLART